MEVLLFTITYSTIFIVGTIGNFTKKLSAQLVFSILLAIIASLAASSRLIAVTQSDDLIRYYQDYLAVKDLGLIDYLIASNREWLFGVLNWLIYQLFDELSPRWYLFIFCIFISFFFSVAILKIAPNRYRLVCITFCMLTPSYLLFSTQLIRQTFAIVLLLNFFVTNNKTKFIFLIFSLLIHKAMIIILVPYLLIKRYKKVFFYRNGLFVYIGVSFSYLFGQVISGSFQQIIKLATGVPLIGNKALFLLNIEPQDITISTIFISSVLLFFMSVFLYNRNKHMGRNLAFENFILFYFVLFCFVLTFAGFKPLSERFSSYLTMLFPVSFFWLISCLKLSWKKAKTIEMIFTLLFLLLFYKAALFPHPFSIFNGVVSGYKG